jgi:hypothetical protein
MEILYVGVQNKYLPTIVHWHAEYFELKGHLKGKVSLTSSYPHTYPLPPPVWVMETRISLYQGRSLKLELLSPKANHNTKKDHFLPSLFTLENLYSRQVLPHLRGKNTNSQAKKNPNKLVFLGVLPQSILPLDYTFYPNHILKQLSFLHRT